MFNSFKVEDSLVEKMNIQPQPRQKKRKVIEDLSLQENLFSGETLVGMYPDLILILSSRGIILYTGTKLDSCLGYTQEELIGQKLNDLVYPGTSKQLDLILKVI